MNRPFVLPPALKRKRAETQTPDSAAASDAEAKMLELIKSRQDSGIWIKDIKLEMKIPDTLYNKAVKSLLSKNLIKEVANARNKGKKHYMAAEFEPSEELSGGDFYLNGDINTELIDAAKRVCFRYLTTQRAATLEGIHKFAVNTQVFDFNITREHVAKILNMMVLNNDIIEVKSTGMGEYYQFPLGTVCYRVANAAGVSSAPKMATFASIPCGSCPRINMCTSDGIISPSTCVYYSKWLNIEF